MDVRYADNKLQKLCSDEREMRRKRPDIEKKLRLRVYALKQATNVGHLQDLDPGGKWHTIDQKWPGHWAGWVSHNERIVFKPMNDGAAMAAISVTVVYVGDYHTN